MEHASSERISEALRFLEEAAATKKNELKSVMSGKYTHLRNVIVETESKLAKSLSGAGKHSVEAVAHAKDVGVEKAGKLARDVDKKVHRNPWSYIAGTAAVGLLLGYMLGRSRE